MGWLEVSVRVDRDAAAAVEALMADAGALAITLLDAADHPVLEPSVGETPLWPDIDVVGLFEADAGRERLAESLHRLPGVTRPETVAFRTVEDADWARAWMDRFRPMRFGERLWIVPGDQAVELPDDATAIRLDPGLAFGTGTHPTTALCLEWLADHPPTGASVIDYGCGSGILAVAALALGASAVQAIDHDPQALSATRANAERNGVAERVTTAAAGAAPSVADLVLANILAGPLVELAELLSGAVRPGGALVLSGVLTGQSDGVAAAYEPWFGALEVTERDGWVRLDGVRT